MFFVDEQFCVDSERKSSGKRMLELGYRRCRASSVSLSARRSGSFHQAPLKFGILGTAYFYVSTGCQPTSEPPAVPRLLTRVDHGTAHDRVYRHLRLSL